MAKVREISPTHVTCNRQEIWPGYTRMEELSLPLLTWTKQSSCPRWCECRGTGPAPCCLLLWVDKPAKTMLGGLIFVVTRRESRQADQPGYNPGPELGLQISSPNTHFIYELLECVKGSDLQVQSYRISMKKRQQEDIQEESQWETSIESVAEARVLETDLIAMNTCK